MTAPLTERLFGISIRPPKAQTVGELVLSLRESGLRSAARVIVARPDDTVADAHALFRRFDLHHLPVLEDKRVIGIVSTTDLLEFFASEHAVSGKTSLGEIMTANPKVIAESAPLKELIDTLGTATFRCLPVLGPSGEIWDIVTTRDLVRFLKQLFD